ncbi:ATPase, AAA family, partial [Teladorsagia circumcincta]
MDRSWSDEEIYDWLRRFSLSLEQAAQMGVDTTKEEIVKDLSNSFSMGKEEDVSDMMTNDRSPSDVCHTSNSSDRSSCSPLIEPSQMNSKDELDSFSNSRRQAIESTIVTKMDELPKLSEIIGLDEAKTALFEALVDPIQYPEWFVSSDLEPWKAILLYGPPGTVNVPTYFYVVAAAVIFIDEVDSLCRTRSSSEDDANRRVKTELLVQIQRLQSTSKVVLVCATNCPWDLDPAFMRRFEKKIYVGLPDYHSRLAMLKSRLLHTTMDSSVSFERIAEATNGFSGDDIRRLATELAYAQFRYYK